MVGRGALRGKSANMRVQKKTRKRGDKIENSTFNNVMSLWSHSDITKPSHRTHKIMSSLVKFGTRFSYHCDVILWPSHRSHKMTSRPVKFGTRFRHHCDVTIERFIKVYFGIFENVLCVTFLWITVFGRGFKFFLIKKCVKWFFFFLFKFRSV